MNPKIPELIAELETLVHGHVEDEETLNLFKAFCVTHGVAPDPWDTQEAFKRVSDQFDQMRYLRDEIKYLRDEVHELRGDNDFDEDDRPRDDAPPRPTENPLVARTLRELTETQARNDLRRDIEFFTVPTPGGLRFATQNVPVDTGTWVVQDFEGTDNGER